MDQAFFADDSATVAEQLIGSHLVHELDGPNSAAASSRRRRTTEIMM